MNKILNFKPIVNLSMMLYFLLYIPSGFTAVHLSESNTGQISIIPYFTVANGMNTLIAIDNKKFEFKAIKINIREGGEGHVIYTFNLYLSPYAIWTAALGIQSDFLNVTTNGESCVIGLTNLFRPSSDIPNIDSIDWLTGTIEVIEMGSLELSQEALIMITYYSEDICDDINMAWNESNYLGNWNDNPNDKMLSPTGGLTTTASVIDVNSGFDFNVSNITLKDFFPADSIHHKEPESTEPNLSSGSHDSLLIHDGEVIQTTWPTGYEAVSALLMKTTVENEFDVSTDVGGLSEWVISFPTVRYHKNNGESQLPFIFEDSSQFRFPGTPSSSYVFYDRESNEHQVHYGCVLLPPGVYCPPVHFLNHAVNTYVVNTSFYEPPNSLISGPNSEFVQGLDIDGSVSLGPSFTSGKVKLDIKTETDDERWSPRYANINDRGIDSLNQGTHQYFGLPVVGFAVQIYRNSHAQPGLLATYASAKAHHGEIKIVDQDNESDEPINSVPLIHID